jgi:PST family polysaccharide transporter
MPDISIRKAILINTVSKYSGIVLNLIFTAILSRILTPKDYGIVAVVTVFTVFFGILADLGMGSAVIQNKALTNDEINHIFTFSLYLAIGLAILFCLFGFPLSLFYNNSVYFPIACILSISLFFGTLNMIPNAVLLKDKRFLLVGVRLIIITLAAYGFAIVLALLGFKYYALAIQSVLSALFTLIWNIKTVRLKLVCKINFNSIRKIWQYSAYQFGFNVINYFARNLDKLIIGKVMGDVPLAQYDKAYRMMLYPINNLTHVITPVLHPILSEYQDDKEYIYQRYMKVVKFLSLLGVFVTAECFWCSEEIIILTFGDQWYEAVPVFRWFSLSIWAQMVTGSSGVIFQSLGDTKRLFQNVILNSSISCIAIILGILSGKLWILSICITVSYWFHFITAFLFLIIVIFKMSIFDFLFKFIPELIILSIIFISMYFILSIKNFDNYLIAIFIKTIVIISIYFILMLITRQMKYVKNNFMNKG